MMLADIVDGRLPTGRVTVVTTQMENHTEPGARAKQLDQLLERIKDVDHPVILAGDMNTSTQDLTPTTVRREITKRLKSGGFWLQQGIGYATGVGFLFDMTLTGVRYARTQSDPTVRNVPLLAPNPDAQFFNRLKDFRFADGGSFDFRGDPGRSVNLRGGLRGGAGRDGGTMANSNERSNKGFVTTFQVNRPIKCVGKYKLDWFFVKPARLTSPTDRQQPYRFAPHFGRTLQALNQGVEGRISDHNPLLVDLPLGEPQIGQEPPPRKETGRATAKRGATD
jgi:hypothetical protein